MGRLIESSTSLARTFTHDNVIVSKRELERLVTEVMQMKEFLPKVEQTTVHRSISLESSRRSLENVTSGLYQKDENTSKVSPDYE